MSGGMIMAVGSAESVEQLRGPETKIIDAAGGMVVPGFIDTHMHFLNGSYGLAMVKLRDANTPREFSDRIRKFAETSPEGTWITEGDWDHELWGGQLPHRDWIDQHTPNHPVFVSRLDGHMALVNTAALEAAGIDDSVLDVDGGEIVRDADGRLTGIFKDNAMSLIASRMPDPTPEQKDTALQAGMAFVAAHGVTSVHNMDIAGPGILETYKRARDRGALITRFYVAIGLPDWASLDSIVKADGRGDEWLRIGVLKGMMDGSLGSHTAAFHEPFADAPEDRGLLLNDEQDMYRWISAADKAELHVAVHAIGDRAIKSLLDMFERVENENGERDRRFRIEHAQHIAPEDIARFSKLDVIASVQPYHAIDDGRWAEKVIGPERIKTTYAFKALLDADTRVAFGSDWAVAPPTPIEGIYAAVTRRTLDDANPNGWVPEQKITVIEALRAYTIDAAYASYEEDIKGSIEVGKLADLVILDSDLRNSDPAEIRNVSVKMTLVGGEVVYSANQGERGQ